MVNTDQLEKLKKGAETWNGWRRKNPNLDPNFVDARLESYKLSLVNLYKAQLSGAALCGADLAGADLRYALLVGSNLEETDLSGAWLQTATLRNSTLSKTNLSGANLRNAVLLNADLRGANLEGADFSGADLSGADLSGAILVGTHFRGARLAEADFWQAALAGTGLNDLNLSAAKGLDTCKHRGPSTIDHWTLAKYGALPIEFLRGCGFADWQIEESRLLNPALTPNQISEIQYRVFELRSARPIQVSPLFISYSHLGFGYRVGEL